MGSDSNQSGSDACSGKDRSLTPARKAELDQHAQAFNLKLQSLEPKDGHWHVEETEAVRNAFWSELSHAHNEERRELLIAAKAQNTELANADPAMPKISYEMGKDTFLWSLTINYSSLFLVHKGNGVDMDPPCRQPSEPAPGARSDLNFTLPSFNFLHGR